MKRINERAWQVFGIYGRGCESCSGAIALSLLQALAMFGCLEKREAGGLTLYCILTFIAVAATIGFFASLISIGRTIHIQSEGHKERTVSLDRLTSCSSASFSHASVDPKSV